MKNRNRRNRIFKNMSHVPSTGAFRHAWLQCLHGHCLVEGKRTKVKFLVGHFMGECTAEYAGASLVKRIDPKDPRPSQKYGGVDSMVSDIAEEPIGTVIRFMDEEDELRYAPVQLP